MVVLEVQSWEGGDPDSFRELHAFQVILELLLLWCLRIAVKFANTLYPRFQLLYLISLIDALLIIFCKLAQEILSVDEVAPRRFAFECLVLGD